MASQVRQMLLDSDVDDSDGSDILIEQVIIHFCKTLTFAGDDGTWVVYENTTNSVAVSCQCHRRCFGCGRCLSHS